MIFRCPYDDIIYKDSNDLVNWEQKIVFCLSNGEFLITL